MNLALNDPEACKTQVQLAEDQTLYITMDSFGIQSELLPTKLWITDFKNIKL